MIIFYHLFTTFTYGALMHLVS